MTVTLEAPAKINLWLRVGARRPTGFHDLDTLFCALELADTLTFRSLPPGTGARLSTEHALPLTAAPDLGPPEENLVLRAVAAFAERAGVGRDVHVHLTKRIPPAGGLGGGSSDAAATLRAMDRIHPGRLDADHLAELAADLGSDVPFFLAGHPLARGRGRGTELTPVAPLPPRPVTLVLPPVAIPTADAYRWLAEERAEGAPGPGEPDAGDDPGAWEQVPAGNDFERVVFSRYPELRRLRDVLDGHGAYPALLAGSGATVFGVFSEQDTAEAAARAIARNDPAVAAIVTRTRAG